MAAPVRAAVRALGALDRRHRVGARARRRRLRRPAAGRADRSSTPCAPADGGEHPHDHARSCCSTPSRSSPACAARSPRPAPTCSGRIDEVARGHRPAARRAHVRRHAPVRPLGAAEGHRQAAVRHAHRPDAVVGPADAHLRRARARRHRGPRQGAADLPGDAHRASRTCSRCRRRRRSGAARTPATRPTARCMFQQLPTAGLPFQFEDWAQLEAYVGDMLHTGVIDQFDEVRWDVRPSPRFGTLEMRICDGASNLAEVARARRADALPRRALLDDARPRRDAADAAAVVRAGEQVALRPVRHGRDHHHERRRRRGARHRRGRARCWSSSRPSPSGSGCAAELDAGARRSCAGARRYQRQRAVARRNARRARRRRRARSSPRCRPVARSSRNWLTPATCQYQLAGIACRHGRAPRPAAPQGRAPDARARPAHRARVVRVRAGHPPPRRRPRRPRAPGPLYPVLNRLERDGQISSRLVASTAGPARKYYVPTESGAAQLWGTARAWRQLAATVDAPPRPAPPRRSPHEHVPARHPASASATSCGSAGPCRTSRSTRRSSASCAPSSTRPRPRWACAGRSPTSATPACWPTATSASSAGRSRGGPPAPSGAALAVGAVAYLAMAYGFGTLDTLEQLGGGHRRPGLPGRDDHVHQHRRRCSRRAPRCPGRQRSSYAAVFTVAVPAGRPRVARSGRRRRRRRRSRGA